MIRLDFPGFSGAESLQEISWKQWFRQFDENNLALLIQEKTSRGQKSNFNKLVSRGSESAVGAREGRSAKPSRETGRATPRSTRRSPPGQSAKPSSRRAASASPATAARRTSQKSGAAQPLTDHAEIREWAEARDARPACVKKTGGRNDPGMIRLDFPGFSGRDSLQEISWREWFRQFEENGLALLVQDTTKAGQPSNFNKLVRRGAAGQTSRARKSASTTAATKRATARTGTSRSVARKTTTRSTSPRRAAGQVTTRSASTRKRSTAASKRRSAK
jgi:hypothetical protein